jgi:hypothetical protein
MGDIKAKYGTSNQSITITLASLADAAKAVSNEISNTANLFLDALVQFKIKTAAAGVSSTGVVYIYAVGSADGGTSYPDSVNQTKLLIGIMDANANATTFTSVPMSVAAAFNGKLPEKWKIVVENQTGAALDATEGNHAKFYQGVLAQG